MERVCMGSRLDLLHPPPQFTFLTKQKHTLSPEAPDTSLEPPGSSLPSSPAEATSTPEENSCCRSWAPNLTPYSRGGSPGA